MFPIDRSYHYQLLYTFFKIFCVSNGENEDTCKCKGRSQLVSVQQLILEEKKIQ